MSEYDVFYRGRNFLKKFLPDLQSKLEPDTHFQKLLNYME